MATLNIRIQKVVIVKIFHHEQATHHQNCAYHDLGIF